MPNVDVQRDQVVAPPLRWRELWLKEDWWAIWLGLGIVLVAYVFFANGASIRWIAVTPAKWSTLGAARRAFRRQLRALHRAVPRLARRLHRRADVARPQGARFPALVRLSLRLSVVIFALGQWDQANTYNLEPPLVALVVGLVLSNLVGLPRWLDAGFRVEFYIKTGIVLLGATLPFTLIVWAGPVAILQASIVSIATFLVIYWVAHSGLDSISASPRRLGAGGAVCGVSAAIAIAGAVGAKKEDAPIAITTVIIWAIAMIFVLPFVAAGAASSRRRRRRLDRHLGICRCRWLRRRADLRQPCRPRRRSPATRDQAVFAFTLMKVVGRDVWIGIWAFVLAIIATTRWERAESGRKPEAAEIWWRFPEIRHRLPRRFPARHRGDHRLHARRLQQDRGARRSSRRSRTCAPGPSSSASSASA